MEHLVFAAEPLSRLFVGRQPFPLGAGSSVTAAETKKGHPLGDPL